MIEQIILGIVAIAGMTSVLVMYALTTKERTNLLDRWMAKSLEEYQYFEKIVPEEVEETKRLRKEARKNRDTQDEEARIEEEKYQEEIDALKNFEEEWSGDEVDLDKLREQMKKEE